MKQRVESHPEVGGDSARLPSREKQEQRIRNILLNQLSRAMKTRQQLVQVLLRKECDPELFEPILDRYEEAELINDQSFATAFADSRSARGVARSIIRRELQRRGVSSQLIEAALSRITGEAELETATKLAIKKLRTMASLEPQVMNRRLFGFLQRRGYSTAVASDAIRRAKSQAVN